MTKFLKILLFVIINVIVITVVINALNSGNKKRALINLPVTQANTESDVLIQLPEGDYKDFCYRYGKFFVLEDNFTLMYFTNDVYKKTPLSTKMSSMYVYKFGRLFTSAREVYDQPGGKCFNLSEGSLITDVAANEEFIFIADAGKRKVYAVSLATKKVVWEIGDFVIPSPFFSLSISPEGDLWVVNPGKHCIQNYDKKSGRLIAEWKPSDAAFVGCCNPSLMCALSGGRFVTMEKGALRVRLFSPSGKLIKTLMDKSDFNVSEKFDYSMIADDERVYILDNQRNQIRVVDIEEEGKSEN